MRGNKAVFIYDSNWDKTDSNIESKIEVKYISKTIIDNEKYGMLHAEFESYLINDRSDNIVDVVIKIKEMFKELEEENLNIILKNGDCLQEVKYIDGKLDSCCFSVKELDGFVSISNDCNGIDIQYAKNRRFIYSPGDINYIYSELGGFFQKVYELRELEKKDEYVKTKKIGLK